MSCSIWIQFALQLRIVLQLRDTVHGTRQVASACHNILDSCTSYRLNNVLLIQEFFFFFFFFDRSLKSKDY